jgi:RNA polymerase sigma-70 factor (ECF subfamily)
MVTARGHQQVADDDECERFVQALYRQHGNLLKRYAARLLGGDWHRAEDLLQEAFARAWRHSAMFDGDIDKARPWLFTVVRNLVIDHHRACRIRPVETQLSDVQETVFADETDRVLTARVVAEALAELPRQQREVITLMYFSGYTVNQAAERLGIPAGTVKSRSYYAMRELRRHLADRGVHLGD